MKKIYLLPVLLLAFANCIEAQTPVLDPGWGTGGIVKTPSGNPYLSDCTNAGLLLRGDSAIYQINQETGSSFIVKRFMDGTIDSTFGTDGVSDPLPITDSHAALQADGSIVVGGLVNIVHYWWGYLRTREILQLAELHLPDGKIRRSVNQVSLSLTLAGMTI